MLQLRPKINKIMKRQISHRIMSCLATTSDVQIDCWLAYSFIFTDSNHYKIFFIVKNICVCQGYLYTSTVDYLTQDPAHISFIWILMVTGWMLPNIVMVTFHAMVIIAFRHDCIIRVIYTSLFLSIYLLGPPLSIPATIYSSDNFSFFSICHFARFFA